MKLSSELYHRCREALLACSEFDRAEILRDLFELSPLLRPFADDLSKSETKRDLVDRTIAFLLRQRSSSGIPPLQIFLKALHDRRTDGDGLKQDLFSLLTQINTEGPSPGIPDVPEANNKKPVTIAVEPAFPSVSPRAKIFLSYARPDEKQVSDLYRKLLNAGFDPWQDKESILPGELWEQSIKRAIRSADFFLAVLSKNSVDRRGVLQKEIKQALDHWGEKLDSDIYLVPVRLEPCQAPENLSDFQWVDLFASDGFARLVKALRAGMEQRS